MSEQAYCRDYRMVDENNECPQHEPRCQKVYKKDTDVGCGKAAIIREPEEENR